MHGPMWAMLLSGGPQRSLSRDCALGGEEFFDIMCQSVRYPASYGGLWP